MLWLVEVLEVGVFFLLYFFPFSCIFFIIPRNSYSVSPSLGVGGIIILTLLFTFGLRKRRRDRFDGNFDPAHVKGGRGSGTLPKIDLGEDGLIGKNGVEDDGVGGRLGAGPGRGRIIAPYPFQRAPGNGSAVGGQQHQNQLQTQQMSNTSIRVAADGVCAALAARCPNKKRPTRQQYVQHIIPNKPTPSGSFPSSFHFNLHLNSNSVSPESYSVLTSDGTPSPGSGGNGIYYQSMGRGHSPRMVIFNPDDGCERLPAFQQANSPTRSGPRQQQRCLTSSSPTTVPSQPPISSRAGTAVVVHDDDGGRVVLCKGEVRRDS